MGFSDGHDDMSSNRAVMPILGNQLFPRKYLPKPSQVIVFMCEDRGLCTCVRHHQQKIVLFLAAMRAYAEDLTDAGYDVRYAHLDMLSEASFESRLQQVIRDCGARRLVHFEIEDKPMEARIVEFSATNRLEREERQSPMFLCSRGEFAEFAADSQPLVMGRFYKRRRQRLGILVDDDGKPTGGRWSFDAENRRKLPQNLTPPAVEWAKWGEHVDDVVALVERHFAEHPGVARDFCWPTTRRQALDWLDRFLEMRLRQFGPYEDAFTRRSATIYHSLLSPAMNLGLVTPGEVIERVLEYARSNDVPIQSLEGFVRQIIGWREFVRGVYREYGDRQEAGNFWSHERELSDAWYSGTTGIPPLDDTIDTALHLGWTHHIPRLMIAGNLMTLCEIEPRAAYAWFMEMYVDSADWVMVPNVYGMALFSDGGLFATKPYICGSNYMLKMSDYGKGDWCDTVDGLYWRFIANNRQYFEQHPRLSVMPGMFDRLDSSRRKKIFAAAEQFLDAHTRSAA